MKTKIHSHVAIFANGDLDDAFIKEITDKTYIIGVDRGSLWLLKHGLTPNLAIGDFDSVNSKELKFIKSKINRVIIFPPDKDFTDTHLAMKFALKLNPSSIILYGAIGTRADHTISNIYLLEICLEKNIPAVIKNRHNEIRLLNKNIDLLKLKQFKYLSIIPYTKKITVSLSNVRYNVEKKIISRGETIGLSNEMIKNKANIKVYQGIVILIQSRD